MLHGLAGAFQGEHLEHMPHVRPGADDAGHLRLLQPLGQGGGVVPEKFPFPHMDEGGGEAVEVGKEGGQVGVGPVALGGVGGAHRLNVVHGNHGVQVSGGLVRLPGGGEVGPGGEEHQPPGQEPPGLFQLQGQLQSQVAPGGVPGHNHVPGAIPQVHQVVPGGEGVL